MVNRKSLLISFALMAISVLSMGIVSATDIIPYNIGSGISYTGNMGTSTEQLFTGVGTITITDCDGTNEDSCTTITMLDRNLGAETAGTGEESYGYHFQWGNNFGFNLNILPVTSNVKVLSGEVIPGYMSGTFVAIDNDNWVNDNNKIDMWGGTFDTTTDLFDASGESIMPAWGDPLANFRFTYPSSGDWKVDSETVSSRQGPCPDGFHIPSAGEWIKVLSMLGYAYDSLDQGGVIDLINNRLLIPFAGSRNSNDGSLSLDNYAYFWLSSPYGISSSASQFITLVPSFGVIFVNNGYARANALSLRCFYNKYERYCPEGTHLEGDECMSNSGTAQCVLAGIPDNSIPTIEDVTINWDITLNDGLGGWQIPTCEFVCNNGYTGINCEAIEYTLTVDLGDGTTQTITGHYGDPIDVPQDPTRDGYSFAGWNIIFPTTMPAENQTITAQWTENFKPVVSGGGGSSRAKDNCPNGDFSDSYYDGKCGEKVSTGSVEDGEDLDEKRHNAAEEVEYDILKFDPNYSDEMNQAYQYSYANSITTMETIDKADMRGTLTRVAMAKMLSQYAINVLGKTPADIEVPVFVDVPVDLDAQYDNGVTLAYKLGIMGINMSDNKFLPFDLVTRAQFGTALSRLLFGIEDGEDVYYTIHLAKLKEVGIISNDDPTLEELRGYVMLMLMRSAK